MNVGEHAQDGVPTTPRPPQVEIPPLPSERDSAAPDLARGSAGTLYGIGLGPGDPELITLKGVRLLQAAHVVFVPTRREGAQSYAATIAAPYLAPSRQQIIPLVYPAGRCEPATPKWEANADEIARRLYSGRLGVFLTEGDPLLYSTFVHALLPLRARHPELTVRVVPGVWSGSAAAAALREPLVEGDERLAVVPATYHEAELEDLVRQHDTLVLLKPQEDLATLRSVIESVGATAVWVQRVGRPEETVLRETADWPARRPDYFSLILVRGGRHLPHARRREPVETIEQ
jgi:precorrin-2/cobalt-factor-2 C20-methyltransferase